MCHINVRNTPILVFVSSELCSGSNGEKKQKYLAGIRCSTYDHIRYQCITVSFEWMFRLLGYKGEGEVLTKGVKSFFLPANGHIVLCM